MLFAINVLRLIDKFPQTTAAKVIAYQLAKSSTSVGANYRAVCNARSRAEFIAKLGTVGAK
jgi:four helix bundle protein